MLEEKADKDVRVVVNAHARYYSDPIELRAGEKFILTGRSDPWDENPDHIWLWAVATDGREGWVPESLPQVKGEFVVAPIDYSARELSVEVGESLSAILQINGWVWCKNISGDTGWVPQKCLSGPEYAY